jgi:hypothetical protein
VSPKYPSPASSCKLSTPFGLLRCIVRHPISRRVVRHLVATLQTPLVAGQKWMSHGARACAGRRVAGGLDRMDGQTSRHQSESHRRPPDRPPAPTNSPVTRSSEHYPHRGSRGHKLQGSAASPNKRRRPFESYNGIQTKQRFSALPLILRCFCSLLWRMSFPAAYHVQP